MQRAWLREFNALGLQLRPQAAKLVTSFLQTCEDPQHMAEALVEHTKEYFRAKRGVIDSIIDVEVIQNVISCMEQAAAQAGEGEDAEEVLDRARQQVNTMDLGDGVQVYNVMTDMRPFEYRRASKEWKPTSDNARVFAPVQSKINIYAHRYHLLWNRLLLQGKYVPEVDSRGGKLLPGQSVITPV